MEKKNVSQQELTSGSTKNKGISLTPKSDERSTLLQKRIPILGTPFTKVWAEGKGWAIALDATRLTQWEESEESVNAKIEKGGLTFTEIIALIYVLIKDTKEQEEFLNGK